MARDFDREMGAEEDRIRQNKAQMEELRLQFVAEVGRFLAEWYLDFARRIVAGEPAVTEQLDTTALRTLKAEVAALAERSHAIATEEFSAPSLWWHLDESVRARSGSPEPNAYKTLGNEFMPSILDEPVRRAMGRIAEPLDKFGYLKSARSAWVQPRKPSEPMRFAYPGREPLTLPPSLHPLLDRYATLMNACRNARFRIGELEQEQRRARAAEKWDAV